MKTVRNPLSFVVVAGGLLGFVVLASGGWHRKMPASGRTQVGRSESISFADGTVLELTESETDLDILRRHRMRGWHGQEYRQVYILADGQEFDVQNSRPGIPSDLGDDSQDLTAADRLLRGSETLVASQRLLLDGGPALIAAVDVDGKDYVDGKDRVVTEGIDFKDRVVDGKDFADLPNFALRDETTLNDERLDMILMGDPGGIWGNLRTGSGMITSGGSNGGGGNNGGGISSPPIGAQVPEPSTLPLAGVAGALALAFSLRHRVKR